jgi:hypothetical protein
VSVAENYRCVSQRLFWSVIMWLNWVLCYLGRWIWGIMFGKNAFQFNFIEWVLTKREKTETKKQRVEHFNLDIYGN